MSASLHCFFLSFSPSLAGCAAAAVAAVAVTRLNFACCICCFCSERLTPKSLYVSTLSIFLLFRKRSFCLRSLATRLIGLLFIFGHHSLLIFSFFSQLSWAQLDGLIVARAMAANEAWNAAATVCLSVCQSVAREAVFFSRHRFRLSELSLYRLSKHNCCLCVCLCVAARQSILFSFCLHLVRVAHSLPPPPTIPVYRII